MTVLLALLLAAIEVPTEGLEKPACAKDLPAPALKCDVDADGEEDGVIFAGKAGCALLVVVKLADPEAPEYLSHRALKPGAQLDGCEDYDGRGLVWTVEDDPAPPCGKARVHRGYLLVTGDELAEVAGYPDGCRKVEGKETTVSVKREMKDTDGDKLPELVLQVQSPARSWKETYKKAQGSAADKVFKRAGCSDVPEVKKALKEFRAKKFEQAAALWELAWGSLCPHDQEVVNNAGFAYAQAGQHLKAIDLYKATLEIGDRTVTLLNLGESYDALGDKPNAVKFYKKWLERSGGARGADKIRARLAALEK